MQLLVLAECTKALIEKKKKVDFGSHDRNKD